MKYKIIFLLLFISTIAFSQTTTTPVGSLRINNTPVNNLTAQSFLVRNETSKMIEGISKTDLTAQIIASIPRATATVSGTVRTTTAEVNPQVYTVAIADNLLNGKVDKTTTVNGQSLSGNVTIPIPVTSVAGKVGAVVLNSGDVGLGNVPNTNFTSAVGLNTAKLTNATHTGEVTGAAALTITNNVVTNAKLAQVPTKTFKGRTTALTGNVEDLTVAQVRADLSINNLDNTTDLNKPISTANQSALNLKANTSSLSNYLPLTGGTLNQASILYRSLLLNGSFPFTDIRSQNLITFQGTDTVNANPFDDTLGEATKNFHLGTVSDIAFKNDIRFSIVQSGSERFSVLRGGNVGIGITNPAERLDVVGNGKFSGNLTTSQDNTMIRVGNNGDIALIKKGGFVGKLAVSSGTPFVLTRSNNATINPSDTFSDIFTIDTNNNGLFIGNVTAPSFFQSSDVRLKNIIKRDGDVIYFTWKDKRDTNTHIGYIAQKVKKTHPDQVNKDEKGMLSVNYIEILVEKIRNLEKEIELLKAK